MLVEGEIVTTCVVSSHQFWKKLLSLNFRPGRNTEVQEKKKPGTPVDWFEQEEEEMEEQGAGVIKPVIWTVLRPV